MFAGVAAIVFLVLVNFRFISKRALPSANKIFSILHIPFSIALICCVILHFILKIPLFDTRPFYIILSGAPAVLSIIAAAASGIKIEFKKSGVRIHRILALTACLLTLSHIGTIILGVSLYQNNVKNIEIRSIDLSNVPDGVYVGECDVTYIYVKAAVTVKSGVIENVELLEHKNERGASAELVALDITALQTLDVDTVSGATNSSTVIKKAIENALSGF